MKQNMLFAPALVLLLTGCSEAGFSSAAFNSEKVGRGEGLATSRLPSDSNSSVPPRAGSSEGRGASDGNGAGSGGGAGSTGGSGSNGGSGSGSGMTPAPVPVPVPVPVVEDRTIPANCNVELKKRGFQYSGGVWRKPVTGTCGLMGIGYVEGDVEIEAAADRTCEQLANLDHRILKATDPVSAFAYGDGINQNQLAILAGNQMGNDQFQYTAPLSSSTGKSGTETFRYREKSRHCSQIARCGTHIKSQNHALGRYAWLKKCEATVPEFKKFLDVVRRIEKCDEQGTSSLSTCLFTNEGAFFFPQVKLRGSASDNSPTPAVWSSTPIKTVDQLNSLASQISDPCPTPSQVAPIDTICSLGCYTGDQRILTSAKGKYEAILDAKNAETPIVAVLSRTSTIEVPRFVNAKVAHYTASQEDGKESLIKFETESGAQLVLTTNHPLLDGSGVMREASTFKIGESLVKADGARDTIVSLTRQEFFGKVYNVAPASIVPEDNLVVSEGLINGSHNFQTIFRSELNRQILRSNLAEGI